MVLSVVSYKLHPKIFTWNVVCILLVTLVFLSILNPVFRLFHYVGRENAETQTEFAVLVLPPSHSELAVIRNYGEYLYAVPFTRKTNEPGAYFERQVVIVKMPDVKTPLSLRMEEIGPLQKMQANSQK